MCRLLGIYGILDGWQKIALEFSKLAEFGMVPPIAVDPGHKDGWGLAGSKDDRSSMLEIRRQLGSAHGSSDYRDTIRSLTNPPHVLLGHIRKASPGIPVTMGNVHPFFRDPWAFIHNGTIYNPESFPLDPGFELVSDGSDSEHLFGFLLNTLANAKQEGNKLKNIGSALSALQSNHSSINCMLSNGSELIAVRDFQRFGQYLTLYYCLLPNGAIICSEPLESPELDRGKWKLLPNHSILRISGSPPRIELCDYSGRSLNSRP